LEQLAPPPRGVPLSLRLHLLSRAAVVPSLAFCLTLSFSLPCLVHLNLLNAWRLSQRRQEAEGTLTGCGRQIDLVFSFRYYQYTFRLPDGSTRTGTSYGSPTPAMEAAHVLDRGVPADFPVPVEYAPEYPQASRIRGTSAANLAGQTLWPLVFLGLVLVLLFGQLAEARAKVRLLRHGIPAWATVTACRDYHDTDGRGGRLMSVEEYKACWRADRAHHLALPDVMEDVPCTFTFLLPGGQEVQAGDAASLDSRTGVPPPVLPVLYDPSSPAKARFLENLGFALRASPAGGWESEVSWGATCLRFVLALAFAFVPVCLWAWWEWRG
jgi:hypothetical protein